MLLTRLPPDLTSSRVPQVALRSLEILFTARDFSRISSEFNRFMDFGFTAESVAEEEAVGVGEGRWKKRLVNRALAVLPSSVLEETTVCDINHDFCCLPRGVLAIRRNVLIADRTPAGKKDLEHSRS